jgi:cytochrome b561
MSGNSQDRYSVVTIVLHWLVAVLVFGLFALGFYMVDLTYYDPWYRSAPALHKGIGVAVFLLVLFRLAWRWKRGVPKPATSGPQWQRRVAAAVHVLLYALLVAVPISGYFISTADGRPLEVFSLFSIPSLVSSVDNLEDIAGAIHKFLAYTLIGIAMVHAAAALKHHFIAKDDTLRSMMGLAARSLP